MISIENVTFGYLTEEPIFEGFDWKVQRGESWAVIGPSGCGKTTLLRLLAGLCHPTHGSISIFGKPLVGPRSDTGLILQDFGLLPWASAWENAALGLRIRDFDEQEVNQRVNEWLTKLDIAEVAVRYPAQLSVGQQQRVAVARTLAMDPRLLLMDEPFSSLDAMARERAQDLIVELGMATKTSILVTHSIEEAAFLGERILVLPPHPIREASIIENPEGRRDGYRLDPAFHRTCDELRRAIE